MAGPQAIHTVWLSGSSVRCTRYNLSEYTQILASDFVKSSRRDTKENFREIMENEVLNLMKLNPIHFDYKIGKKDRTGMIAEDVEPIFPDCCSYISSETGEELFGIDYSSFVPYLIKMIQIQQKEIEELKESIKS